MSVVWCSTGDIIAYYATKPLQGSLFRKFRDQIMGVISTIGPGPGKKSVNKKGKVEEFGNAVRLHHRSVLG